MRLYILASENKTKGVQLEKLTQKILEHCGYDYVNTNIVGAGGDEIDVTAKFVSPLPGGESVFRVICECKAHERPITIDDWDKFLGKIFKNDNNGLAIGLMIALSDANGNVKGDIDEHQDIYKNKIRLITGEGVIESLSKAYCLDKIDVAKKEIRQLTTDTVTNLDLVLYKEEIYWFFSFANDTFSILDKKYNSISAQLENEMLPLLSEKSQFQTTQYRNIRNEKDIVLRRNIVKIVSSWNLMHGVCSYNDLISAVAYFSRDHIVPNEKDIEEGLAELQYVYIDTTTKEVKLKDSNEIDYAAFYKNLFAGQVVPAYLYHDYYKEHIDYALLDKICSIQYGLKLNEDERRKCLFLLKNSPSALCYALDKDPLLKNVELGYADVVQSAKNHFVETLLFYFENDCKSNADNFVFEKLGVRDFQRNITVNVVDNLGIETTINAKKRLCYVRIQGFENGMVMNVFDNFEGVYNKEVDYVVSTSFTNDNPKDGVE